jgi:hypothetical protein
MPTKHIDRPDYLHDIGKKENNKLYRVRPKVVKKETTTLSLVCRKAKPAQEIANSQNIGFSLERSDGKAEEKPKQEAVVRKNTLDVPKPKSIFKSKTYDVSGKRIA